MTRYNLLYWHVIIDRVKEGVMSNNQREGVGTVIQCVQGSDFTLQLCDPCMGH